MTVIKEERKPIGIRVYKTAGRVASAKKNVVITWQDIVNKAMNPVVEYLKNRPKKKKININTDVFIE